MDFFYKPPIPERCPDCNGKGRKPYPSFYPCWRCEGSGRIVHLALTYPEQCDAAGYPMGRMLYAGVIERPYRREDC